VAKVTGKVEIVPGVVGPARIIGDRGIEGRQASRVRLDIRFDRELGRYVCHEVCVFRDLKDQPHAGPVTTETLRDVDLAAWIAVSVLIRGDEGPAIRELPNPDGREPWGLHAPEGVTEGGPTTRSLRWVAHLYRYAFAVSIGATKFVEEQLGLHRSTAGRWVSMARQAGYLGPAEPGKASV
jgi:hypothetical protein